MNWNHKNSWHHDNNWHQKDDWCGGNNCQPDNEPNQENESQQDHLWSSDLHNWHSHRPKKRRFLFLRFMFFFVPMLGVFVASIFFMLRLMYLPEHDLMPRPGMIMIMVFGIPLAFGLLAAFFGGLAFRRFGSPVADIMAALDAVAGGDLRVRIKDDIRGEFGKMAHSFNRMVEELDNAEQNRRNLTADVAHELRTPLHIIQGNLEGMLDGVYEKSDEQISVTLDETRLLTRLVNDLQTLSLAEAGKLHLHCEPVSAADLLEDTVTSFTGLAAENGITIRSEITGDVSKLTISADADRLEQVLNNLVGNAVRYTPEGGSITLRAENIPAGVRLTVEDTGQGIAPEDLPFVFDRFWKAEKARARHEGVGSGLGLAIARQLVQAHGGTIIVESPPGHGTKFVIELPYSTETEHK